MPTHAQGVDLQTIVAGKECGGLPTGGAGCPIKVESGTSQSGTSVNPSNSGNGVGRVTDKRPLREPIAHVPMGAQGAESQTNFT